MHYLFSLVLLAFVGLVSTSAQAGSPMGKDWYGAISIGAAAFTHDSRGANGGGRCLACRNVTIESTAGYNVSGSLGGWMNDVQRTEISAGYRSYEMDYAIRTYGGTPRALTGTATPGGTATVIPILINNYFYPMTAFPSVPQAHQPYFGFGLGVGLWSFENDEGNLMNDSYESVAFMGTAAVGYDFYLSGLKDMGVSIPAVLQSLAVGVNYQFSWSNPRLFANAQPASSNQSFNQNSHIVSATVRFEF